jgi:hypothetical protein
VTARARKYWTGGDEPPVQRPRVAVPRLVADDAPTVTDRVLAELVLRSRERTMHQLAVALGFPAYSPERDVLRGTLIAMSRDGLLRNVPHPVHGRWALTARGRERALAEVT